MTNNKQQTEMNKEFIPYELALELKQLGFDEPCIAHYTVVPEDNINWFTISEQAITGNSSIFGSSKNYNTEWFETEGTISAPTYSQAFRWFREKYNLHALIMPKTTPSNTTVYYIYKGKFEENWDNCFEAYEEAELDCLKKLIEIVNGKQ